MKHKKLTLITILTLIISIVLQGTSFASANFTPLPELPQPIIIKADGTVEPPTAPLQKNGNIYTLTGNVNNTIEIQCADVELNGNGFVITKPNVETGGLMMPVGWLPGVLVADINDVTVRNVVFENCITGITVRNASKVNIIQNTMLSGNGIVVLSSSSINILGNNITLAHSSTGINFLPITPADSKPKQVRIEGNQIKGTNTQIPTSQMQPEQRGIWGEFSGSIIGNSLTSIKGNALYYTGSNNLITDNNFQYNYVGILFTGTADKCIYNRIYHNNFDRNGENVIVPFVNSAPKNYWNNDTTGNYWSDYFGVDANGDGIGDTPYILEISYRNHAQNRDATEERGRDNCPLMKRINISSIIAELNQNFSSQTQTPVPDDGTQPFNPLSFVVIGTIAVSVLVTAVYFRKKRV